MPQHPLFVSTDWLAKRLNDRQLRLLDATTFIRPNDSSYGGLSGREVYAKEHIPGAVHADLLHDFSDPEAEHPFTLPSRERFVEKISQLGVGDGTYVVVYDQGTVWDSPATAAWWASLFDLDVTEVDQMHASYFATRLAWQLMYEGFDDVSVLDGGFAKWKAEGRPVTNEPGHYPPAKFTGKRRPELLATKEDVKHALDDENAVIIDCNAPAVYRGEANIYERNGHIPNSVNIPFAELADHAQKKLHKDEVLKEKFEKVGALDPNKKVITYCGSGLAATWNALALRQLGKNHVSVYIGSMKEWTADPTLPVHNPKAEK